MSLEDDHVAERLPSVDLRNGFINLFQWVSVGYQFIQLEPTLLVQVDEAGDICL